MKGSLDFVQILFDYVKASSLYAAITGNVYKLRRPLNAHLEDVVINCLPVDSEQLQRTIANVNVYVPSIPVANLSGEEWMPDTMRLKVLETLSKTVLESYTKANDYHFEIQAQVVVDDQESKSFFINNRIAFYALNVNKNL